MIGNWRICDWIIDTMLWKWLDSWDNECSRSGFSSFCLISERLWSISRITERSLAFSPFFFWLEDPKIPWSKQDTYVGFFAFEDPKSQKPSAEAVIKLKRFCFRRRLNDWLFLNPFFSFTLFCYINVRQRVKKAYRNEKHRQQN